jgi:hypothetical protein
MAIGGDDCVAAARCLISQSALVLSLGRCIRLCAGARGEKGSARLGTRAQRRLQRLHARVLTHCIHLHSSEQAGPGLRRRRESQEESGLCLKTAETVTQ